MRPRSFCRFAISIPDGCIHVAHPRRDGAALCSPTARALRSPQLRLPPALLFALAVACLLPALAPIARPATWPPAAIPRADDGRRATDDPAALAGRSSQLATGQSQRVVPGVTPIGLSAPEWQSIRRQIAAGSYRTYPADGGFNSANPAQGWQIAYGADGTTHLHPRDHGATPWQWGLTLAGYGYAALTPLRRPRALEAEGQSLTYQWDANLREWWRNDPAGLEQGFTLQRPPAGAAAGRPLRLELALSGDLRAELGDGAIGFSDQAGAAAFTYAGLRAWDAAGQELPALMELTDGRISLIVEDAGATYPLTIDPTVQQARLTNPNPEANGSFGWSVAIDGDTIVVGTFGEYGGGIEVNSGRSDNSIANADSGTAYIFVRSGTSWRQQAYLKASNAEKYDGFGGAVAIAGSTVVVGASGGASRATGVNGDQGDNSAFDSGAAYVFVRSRGSWSQQDYLKVSRSQADNLLGASVAIAGDTVVTGAYAEIGTHRGHGAAYVFALPPTDSTPPTVTIEQAAGQDDPAGSSPVAFTVTFSEEVAGFDATEVILSGTAGATTADISGGPAVYTIAVSGMAGDGTVSVSIPADVAEDAAGNPSAASTSTDNTVTFAPATPVTTGIARAGASPTNTAIVSFTVTFSEDVTGVDTGDFTLTSNGISGASIGTVSGAGGSYTVSVSTGTGSGSLRLDLVDDDSIADGTGNPLGGLGVGNGSFSAGQVYTIDRLGPTGALTVSNIAVAGGLDHTFTVRFADNSGVNVHTLDGDDIRVTGPRGFSQLAAFVSVDMTSDGTPRTATYRISAPGGSWGGADNGTYTIALQATQVNDVLGNPAATATLGSFNVDLPTPGATIYLPIVGRPG